ADGRARWLRRTYEAYAAAYRRTGGYWTGINAATSALLLGHRHRARALAAAVGRQCRGELARRGNGAAGGRSWLHAPPAEAALIAGRVEEARDWYLRAVAELSGAYRCVASSRRNAGLLVRALGLPWEPIDTALALPRVVVFAGHMVDRPGRPTP